MTAPIETRFKRCQARGRVGGISTKALCFNEFAQKMNEFFLDDETLQEFQKSEEVQLASTNCSAQQLLACKAIADVSLTNHGKPADFYSQIDQFLVSTFEKTNKTKN